MRVRHVASLAAAVLTVISTLSDSVDAQTSGRGTDVDVSNNDEGFTIYYERPGGYSTGGDGGSFNCTYRLQPVLSSDGSSEAEGGLVESQGVEEVGPGGVAYREDPNGGGRMTLYFRSGPDCATQGPVWVSDSLTPESLIPSLRIEITRILPLPVPNMSPDPSVGSYVNLGLWIAIEDPGAQTIRLSDGPVWAEGTGTLTGFTFDPGDGSEPFDCALTGVPYVEGSQTLDEGPCGYTYTQRSPSGGSFPMTITANYDVTYVLSNGTADGLGIISREDGFPYDVDEIQTVGTGR